MWLVATIMNGQHSSKNLCAYTMLDQCKNGITRMAIPLLPRFGYTSIFWSIPTVSNVSSRSQHT